MSTQTPSPTLDQFRNSTLIPESITQLGILIVDDQPDHLEMMREILLKAGYENVHGASGGQQALDVLEEQHSIGVVLLDLVMPGMDGYAVCRRIKENPVTQDICVIVVTGGAIQVEEAIGKSFEAGAIDFITKPLNRHDLLARTQSSLNLYFEKQQNLYHAGELLLREEKYRTLFESSMDAIFVLNPTDLVVLEANPAAENLIGFALEELSGRAFTSFCPKNADLDIYRQVGELNDGECLVLETEQVTRAGEKMSVEIKFAAYSFQGAARIMATVSDISLRNESVEDLKLSEERLALAVIAEDNGIWDWDISSGEIYFSENWRKFLGIGKNTSTRGLEIWKEHIHPSEVDHVLSNLRNHWNGDSNQFAEEHRLQDRNGNFIWVLSRGKAFWNKSGEVVRMAGTLTRIHEKKQSEAQKLRKQKMDSLHTFTGSLANQLGGLLHLVGSHSHYIKDAVPGNKDVSGFVSKLLNATAESDFLVKQLSVFNSETEVQLEYLFVEEEICSKLPEFQEILGDSISLETEIDKDLPPILVDQPKIYQALLNLVLNAEDAMPDGGKLTLGASTFKLDEIRFEDEEEYPAGNYLQLSVADNGVGMDEQTVEQAFEPFFSTKGSDRPHATSGLGLAAVYAIMKQHHGWISVKSRPGIGTRFDLFFPIF